MAKRRDTWGDQVATAVWARTVRPAPGDLRIVQAFLNTRDLATGTEELQDRRALGEWLTRWQLIPASTQIGMSEFQQAFVIREDLRAIVQGNCGAAVDREAVKRIDRAVADATLRIRFVGAGATRFEPAATGFDGALARLSLIVTEARNRGGWRRLKICANDACRRVFYDYGNNRKGKWCYKRVCGDPLYSRTYRRRRRS